MWSLEHLWSISVEEQFYLVWPLLLTLILRWTETDGPVKAAALPAFAILASPILRVALRHGHSTTGRFIAMHVLTFDFISFGCLVALLQHTKHFERFYRAATKIWWAPPAIILLCSFLGAKYENYFNLTVGDTILGLAIAMFLLWTTRHPESAAGKLLNLKAIVWVGVLSYSIYLWQTLWLHVGNESVFQPVAWLGRFPMNWIGFMVCAIGSYYLVEQPSLRLRGTLLRQLREYRRRYTLFR